MSFASVIALLFSEIGVTLPQFVLIITALGSLIFIAVEIRFGLMFLFFMFGVETVVFWWAGVSLVDLLLVVMCLLSSFVMMALSLLLIKSSEQSTQGLI